jgi:hypothetical protein
MAAYWVNAHWKHILIWRQGKLEHDAVIVIFTFEIGKIILELFSIYEAE